MLNTTMIDDDDDAEAISQKEDEYRVALQYLGPSSHEITRRAGSRILAPRATPVLNILPPRARKFGAPAQNIVNFGVLTKNVL